MRFFFHTQLIGSVTHVTAAAQTVVERYEYDPYGAITIKDQGGSSVSSSPIGNAYAYTGRQFDPGTGLYYYRARQYSPELRRFVQRDPIEYIDSPNPHAYVCNRPIACIDPLGQMKDHQAWEWDGENEVWIRNPSLPWDIDPTPPIPDDPPLPDPPTSSRPKDWPIGDIDKGDPAEAEPNGWDTCITMDGGSAGEITTSDLIGTHEGRLWLWRWRIAKAEKNLKSWDEDDEARKSEEEYLEYLRKELSKEIGDGASR